MCQVVVLIKRRSLVKFTFIAAAVGRVWPEGLLDEFEVVPDCATCLCVSGSIVNALGRSQISPRGVAINKHAMLSHYWLNGSQLLG